MAGPGRAVSPPGHERHPSQTTDPTPACHLQGDSACLKAQDITGCQLHCHDHVLVVTNNEHAILIRTAGWASKAKNPFS